MNMQEATSIMKADSYKMAALSEDTRNNILVHVKDALIAHKDEIFAANAKDMAAAEENGIAASVKKRLKFDEHKLADVTNGIDELIKLPDPVGQIQLKRELDEGLVLQRVSCPIGVIGIIFEARPDALVQISSLCIKSGNCAVLKGGKETANTNKALFDVIYSTAVANGAPEGCMLQASQRARQIRVSRIRAEQPDGLHRVQSQATRKGIGYIAAAVNDLHHLPARLLRHMGAVVQYAGYGCDGHACVTGNIIDVHSRHSPFHSRCVNTSILRVNPHYTRFFPLLQASFSRFRADIHRKSGVLFPRLHKLQEISAEPLTEARKESRINAGVL